MMYKVKSHNHNHEIIQETHEGLRRSSRIRKPTKEILNYRKELKDDVYEFEEGDINFERSSSYLLKSNQTCLIDQVFHFQWDMMED